MTERDWALLTGWLSMVSFRSFLLLAFSVCSHLTLSGVAKSETVKFSAGDIVLDKGQPIKFIYLIKSGSVRKVREKTFKSAFFFFSI